MICACSLHEECQIEADTLTNRSHCKEQRPGVIWSQYETPRHRLAALCIILVRGSSVHSGRQYRVAVVKYILQLFEVEGKVLKCE